MEKITRLLSLILLIGLSGCATAPPPISSWDVPTVAAKTTPRRDEFKKLTSINSPRVLYAGDGLLNISRFELTAERKDGEEVRYFLLMFTQRRSSLGWAFWETAADQNGKQFTLIREGTEVLNGGIVQELYSARVTREYLESVKTGGITWQFYGRRATERTPISANLVSGFLNKADDVFGHQATATPGR